MNKTKSDTGKPALKTALGRKTGSSLDIKTNQDFKKEHPDHDASGMLKGIYNPKESVDKSVDKQSPYKKLIIKSIAAMVLVFMCSWMFTSCMDMKRGMKTDMHNHGATTLWIK